jgi:outer membrane receptor protein involved in Fe transport
MYFHSTAIAYLEHTCRFKAPVKPGDTLTTTWTVTDKHGRIEFIEDFPSFDHSGDGVVDDDDLLFAVTLRSGKPDQALIQPDADNTHVAGFIQDDWAVSSRVQLNLGLRYEIDTEVNNQSRVGELNPIVLPFVTAERRRDLNNLGPRVGFAWNAGNGGLVVRGG